jgi:ABC-type nitrate/sulfonate/bicarbonate transport system substrate-binding protein
MHPAELLSRAASILAGGSVSRAHSQEVLVRAGSPIRGVSDLKGKKIAAV